MNTYVQVIIVGAGPAGLASAACLKMQSIPSIVIEKEACSASLWKCRAYDRLKLHLAKKFCELPYMSYPKSTPTFIPKSTFIDYLDNYVNKFNLSPIYSTIVECASFDEVSSKWSVVSRNLINNEVHEYSARFLVVATGENSEGFIPGIKGLSSFPGKIMHSAYYKSGVEYSGKKVLVVGSGNSGMEIAYDLANHGAKTSIIIKSPLHVMTKEMIHLGMVLLRYIPSNWVDKLITSLAKLKYGNLSKFGLKIPSQGPFSLKSITGRSPVIDVGTVQKIQSGEIQVLNGGILEVKNDQVKFIDDQLHQFHAIVFATGYKSTVRKWLKGDDLLFNKDGMPKEMFPNHWKGKNYLYSVGFARRGLAGISMDARNIANDIKHVISSTPSNYRTTHIFDNCILDASEMEDNFEANCNYFQLNNSLSCCDAFKKNFEETKDVKTYSCLPRH